MFNKVKLKFINDMEYNGYVFSGGKIYEVVDEPKNFVLRCERRLALKVDPDATDYLVDPRYESKEISQEIKVETKTEEIIEVEKEVVKSENKMEDNSEVLKSKKNKNSKK